VPDRILIVFVAKSKPYGFHDGEAFFWYTLCKCESLQLEPAVPLATEWVTVELLQSPCERTNIDSNATGFALFKA